MQDVSEDVLQEETQIYVCDINPNMLNVGKKRAMERGNVQKSQFEWLFFLYVGKILFYFISSFVIRNEIVLTLIGLGENQSLMWVEGDAEALTFDNNSMDGYTIAFGIRNVTHIEKALAEAYR